LCQFTNDKKRRVAPIRDFGRRKASSATLEISKNGKDARFPRFYANFNPATGTETSAGTLGGIVSVAKRHGPPQICRDAVARRHNAD
jgi:hypothetical protein